MIAPQRCFSALQRAEIAEISGCHQDDEVLQRFSALQRAEIAEIEHQRAGGWSVRDVSVLFNEPKLLK